MNRNEFVEKLQHSWESSPRWKGIRRPYTAAEVWRLRGSIAVEHTLARHGAARLWQLLAGPGPVAVLSAITGNQAIEEVQAGLQAIYVSGWQVAADMNGAGQVYPDLSLYPSDSVPALVRQLNNALLRADQIEHLAAGQATAGKNAPAAGRQWLAPLVADAEAGFGGALNAFELVKALIDAGAAGIHLEDQLSSVKKCGHMGGKVLVPTREFVEKLVAARLAADVCGVETLLIARTDVLAATLLTSDIDANDRPFLQQAQRTPEGFYPVRNGIEAAIARAKAYAPYADLLWFETAHPDMEEARRFAAAVRQDFPGKLLAYNCSPSFNWKKHMDERQARGFQQELAGMGYAFQFVTLSAFHALNYGMFRLARDYREQGMAAYSALQQAEIEAEREGYQAVRHQEFVGTGYFDEVTRVVSGGVSSVMGLAGSTEREQF